MTTKAKPQKKLSGLFPVPLVKKLEVTARQNDRSVAAEMRVRLERSFSGEPARAAQASSS